MFSSGIARAVSREERCLPCKPLLLVQSATDRRQGGLLKTMTASRWASLAAVVALAVLCGRPAAALNVAVAAPKHPMARAKHCKATCHKAAAFRYLAKHRYSYGWGSAGGSNGGMDLDLCADGTLHATGDVQVYRRGAYDFSFDGTWAVLSASRWKAKVVFTTGNYQTISGGGLYSANPPPSAGVLRLWIKARMSTGVRDGGGLFNPIAVSLSRGGLPSGSCPVVGAPAGA
jgi:hypothetical protein